MAPPESDDVLLPSVIDRIINPHSTRDPARSLPVIRSAILRDVRELLNTRVSPRLADRHEDLSTTVLGYGLPDTSSLTGGRSDSVRRLSKTIETALRTFEPRLRNLSVFPAETPSEDDEKSRQIRFVIQGTLHVDPEPVRMSFDTVLDPSRGDFEVERDA